MSLRIISSVPNQPYLYIYLTDDAPTFGWSFAIPSYDANDMVDDPVFLSPSKTLARRLRWTAGGFVTHVLPVEYGQREYVLMRSPSGSLYAYGLNDDGTFYIEPFDSAVPNDRRVRMTLMHKGRLIFVGDNRQPMPRPGDEP